MMGRSEETFWKMSRTRPKKWKNDIKPDLKGGQVVKMRGGWSWLRIMSFVLF
jgi:hypothetical protein